MIEVVNISYKHMLPEFESVAEEWAQACSVQREVTYGGSGFKGNSCKILLNKVDISRQKCPLSFLKFVRVFEDFKSVVNSCLVSLFSLIVVGNKLDPNYKEKIATFKRNYLDLKVSVTPKVHAVFCHVEDFCELKNIGLGIYSEQAMKTVHHDFSSFCYSR